MDDAQPPVSNIPEYSVSEISGAVKRTLEGAFARVRVRGEITEMKRYPSGHIYLSLKDEGGKLAGVIWKSAVPRLGMAPENGVEVVATGRVSAYGDRSSYQLLIERLEYAGAGALLARIEKLRQTLAAEGLFDAARKRALPLLPRVIGVVTSERGAVLQDIRTTIARRFPRPILLWPVPVQGDGAALRIAAAIAGFNALTHDGPIAPPDVLIVARGGGSLEDLMAFNDEAVVRAARASRIPLIAAVGHETDTTLIDLAADRRAPTPTAAAEMAVPVRSEMLAMVRQFAAAQITALSRHLRLARLQLEKHALGLPDLPALTGAARQRLDDRADRLARALPASLATRRARLALPGAQLQSALRHAIALRRAAAGATLARLSEAPLRARLREARARLEGFTARLEGAAHPAVLARGYALVLDAAGAPLARAAQIRPGARLRLRFADGEIAARAEPAAPAQARLPLGDG